MNVKKCDRCRKRYRNEGDWNAITKGGYMVGLLCPDCQTVEENADAVINESTLDYHHNPYTGQVHTTPKGL